MHVLVESLLIGWNRNLDYAKKLVADLSAEQMLRQPQPNMNHPAWIFSHLNGYHGVLVNMLRGQSFDDPKNHKFGMQSKPLADASVYPSKAQLIGEFENGHAAVAAALSAASDADLNRPTPLERWQKPFPTVGSALGYIMLVHESTHLGQISAWRRVQGLASV